MTKRAHPTKLGYLTLAAFYKKRGYDKKALELERKAYALLSTQLNLELEV